MLGRPTSAVAATVVMALLPWGPLLGAEAADHPPPAAAFGSLPQFADLQLSPDGRLLAWCDESGAAAKVVVLDLAAKAYRRTIDIGPVLKERSLQWSGDHTLLVTVSDTRAPLWVHYGPFEIFRTMAVNVDSGQSHMLLMDDGVKTLINRADLLAWRTAKQHTVVMATLDYSVGAQRQELGTRLVDARADSGWILRLFDVDTRSGNAAIIDQGDQFTQQWAVDAQGRPVARSEWRPSEHHYWIEAKSGRGWRTILDRGDGGTFTLHGVSADGKSVLATGPGKQGWVRLWAIGLDGSGSKDLTPGQSADVEGVIRDRFTGAPVGVQLGGLQPKVQWLDTTAEARYESVAHAFPGHEVSVDSRSADGSRVIAEVQGQSAPPMYYLVDFKAHRADIVGEAYPGLDNVALGEVRNITYQARDGVTIPAYLTLPPGRAPKRLPMILLPHGGPAARDMPRFDWLAQFFATRGYAVLQPQFRGSTGFGVSFEDAGARQWGRLMQDDLTDGVQAMIRQGIADPGRICIVGGSYGGYAALAGAAFTPDLYACAVSINGVSDLPALLTSEKESDGAYGGETNAMAYLEGEIGTPSDPKLVDASPVYAAARIKAPVMLLHASDDTVVPIQQSEEMARALERLGKPVSFVRLPGEDHWLSRAETRTEVLRDTDRFVSRYLH